jgi:hypothetical protein
MHYCELRLDLRSCTGQFAPSILGFSEPQRHPDVESMGTLEPEYSMDRGASRDSIPCERRYVTHFLRERSIVDVLSFVNCGHIRERMGAPAVISNLACLVGVSLDVAWQSVH